MEAGLYIAIAVAGYVIGSFPTAYIVVARFARKNILDYGTGNVGTMNTHRATNSKALTFLVLAGDLFKGAAGAAVGYGLAHAGDFDTTIGAGVGGVLAVVGHNYSMFLGFKGGKGLATSGAVLLWVAPWLVPVWVGAFFAVLGLTKFLVVGQIVATLVLPPVAHVVHPDTAPIADAIVALVFIRHAPRIKNVLEGTEPKLYYKVREPARE